MSAEISRKPALLCCCRLALAVGIVWGLGLVVLGAIAMATGEWCDKAVEVLGSVYWGFAATGKGLLLGLLWGFGDGFIGTLIIVGLYNLLCRVGRCCCTRDTEAQAAPAEGAPEQQA